MADDITITLPGDEDDSMATTELDGASNEYWREDLRSHSGMRRDSSLFWSDAQRSAFLEGKVGMRESVAMRNIPPINTGTPD